MSTKAITNGKSLSAAELLSKQREGDKLKLFIASWNMGNAEPAGMETIFGATPADLNQFDVYAIGLQESTYNVKGSEDSIAHLSNRLKTIFRGFYVVCVCMQTLLPF